MREPESRNPDRLVGTGFEDDFTETVDGAAAFERERAADLYDDEPYYRRKFR